MDNLTTIKHTKHADDSDFDQLISEGWMLLHVYSQTIDDRTHIYYVMGHEGPIEEKQPVNISVHPFDLEQFK